MQNHQTPPLTNAGAPIVKDRAPLYGPFANNGDISQALKAVCHELPSWANLNAAQQEAMDLICTKMSRIMSGDPNYKDNWDDIAGYATLGSQHCDFEKDDEPVLTAREQAIALIADLDLPQVDLDRHGGMRQARDIIVKQLSEGR